MTEACDRFNASLLELAYDELPPEASEPLRRHAAGCPQCREALEQILLVRKMAGQLPAVEPPGAIDAAVLRAAAEETGRLARETGGKDPGLFARLRAAMLAPALATAAAAVLVFAISYFLTQRGAGTGARPQVAERAPSGSAVPRIPAAPKAEPRKEEVPAVAEAPPVEKKTAVRSRPARRPPAESQRYAQPPPEPRGFASPPPPASAERLSAGAATASPAAFARDADLAKGQAASAADDCAAAENALAREQEGGAESPGPISRAIHRLARCETGRGRCGDALPWYEKLLSGYPDYPDRAEALFEAAGCCRTLGRISRARALLAELGRIPGWEATAEAEVERLAK